MSALAASKWEEDVRNGASRREPDFENLLKVLRREKPSRPTLFEFFMNQPLYEKMSGMKGYEEPSSRAEWIHNVKVWIEGFRRIGYDYATLGSWFHGALSFPAAARASAQTVSINEGGVISDRESFEKYAWQDPEKSDYSLLEDLEKEVPAGMRLVASGPGGVLENVISLVGYENLCYIVMDDEELASDIFEAVGSRLVTMYRKVCAYDVVGAAISNDDWGFKTQTMLAPTHMRQFVFPWHKRIVETIHESGKPAILHSCGKFDEIIDDIADDMKYDGRHSYEDAILPVEEAYDKYGDRFAILGGLDVDFICRSEPEDIYKRAKGMIERSSEKGGYGLGTGNSVPTYVPDEKYFAMIKAAVEEG